LRIRWIATISDVPGLIARGAEVDQGLERLRSSGRLTVAGLGGIGKTTLAGAVAERLGPDRTLWIEADSIVNVDVVASRLLDELAEIPLPGESPAATLASVAEGRLLIVVDGGEAMGGRLHELLASVPVTGAGPWVLVTTRFVAEGDIGPVLRLGPLATAGDGEAAPAMRMFRERFLRAGGSAALLDASAGAARRLVADSAGVPLAVAVVAARAAALGFGHGERSAETASPEMMTDAVGAAVGRTLRLLDPVAVRLFSALGVTAGVVTTELAASVGGLDPVDAASALERLARHSLVEPSEAGYTVLPPIRRHARRWSKTMGLHDGAVERHRQWALQQCAPIEAEIDRRRVLGAEPEIRLAITRALEPAGCWDDAAKLAQTLFAVRGDVMHPRCREVLEEVLAASMSHRSADVDRRIELLRETAIARGESEGTVTAIPLLDRADELIGASLHPERNRSRILSIRSALVGEAGSRLNGGCGRS
jgi:hypothetical protein